jgi:GH15 family glucan-1,4-alpha-glucosidase
VLGVLGADGSLPQSYDDDTNRFDASALLVVMFGMLSGDDPRAAALVDRHLRELGDGVHMRRYSAMDDGFHGREATFVPCSWWAVTALSAIGRHDAADERCDALCRELPRLLAEEFDPATGESRGNLPLVWSHAEAARALHVLRVR